MLVLSRKRDEKIIIGDDIQVTVIDVRGKYVRLGIDAPPSVRIVRDELLRSVETTDAPAISTPSPQIVNA